MKAGEIIIDLLLGDEGSINQCCLMDDPSEIKQGIIRCQ
jgi:hypothetical protein